MLLGLMVCTVSIIEACPFCSSVGLTFTDQMDGRDVVVSARLVEIPEADEDAEELPRAKFEIDKVFRGQELVKSGMEFEALLVGRYPVGEMFFVMGVDPPQINWTTPLVASERVLEYLGKLDDLPESGAERLAFFQDYFEDEESLLAFDAYDEFAKAPYEDLIDLKDKMDRERLIKMINNDKTSPNRRRLYFTMLGVCGEKQDAKMLEELLLSGSRRKMRGLEALIACYLKIEGESGMDLIQREFFEKKDCEFTYTMLAMQALRFHAEETDVIPKERIVAAARKVLDNEEARDLVIPDLARWEDWSVMEKLVKIFKESSEDNSWIRVPIASYLMACPLPEAKQHLVELKEMDSASIKRAEFLGGIDFDSDEDEDDDEEVAIPVPAISEISTTYVAQTVSIQDTSSPEQNYASRQPVLTRHVVKKVEQPAIAAEKPVAASANQVEQTFVSTKVDPVSSAGPVVKATPPTPASVPVAVATPRLTWQLIVFPVGVSILLFILLWSVLNGWFERLIF